MKLLNRKNLEIRKAYFLKAFGIQEEEMAIVSFGACNFHCPYCKRDCQHIDNQGNVISTTSVSMEKLKEMIDTEVLKGRRVRLSGGDPCSFPKQSLEIAKYVFEKYGDFISIAHNGSDPEFIRKMLPYLKYVAIDFKAMYHDRREKISGVKDPIFAQEEIAQMCLDAGVLVDFRTPVFGDTSLEELEAIASTISKYPNVFWTLRKYNKVAGCDFTTIDIEDVVKLGKSIKGKFPYLRMGSRNYWKGGFEIY